MNSDRKFDPLPDVLEHYQQVEEDSRLRSGWFRLEFARTQELIKRHLQPAPAVVLDVGGGSGVYSHWLAGLGYEVHLIDPVPKHIEQARTRSAQQPRHIATMRIGDARHLEQADGSVDAVLLLGPLYHLTDRNDRIVSLREAHRVLRLAGVLFAAGISRFASLFDSLHSGFFDKPEFAAILQRDLAEGQHRNPTENPTYFTTAFFHRPAELAEEITEAGFLNPEVFSIEGPGWMAQDFERLWADETQRTRLLDCIRKVEREPEILGASSHLLAIAHK
jgi:ubiquinone/menaquinone biosynthesis C-methylase UbiE